MFEELDLQIGEDTNESSNIIRFTQVINCTRTASGGYGTSCKYCC
jgi:hypothetical protein